MSSNEKSLELSSRPAAEAYVSKVCFKLGPPKLIGAELEWLTARPDGSRPSLDSLAAALGPYAPRSISPESPARVLPGGSVVTVEPGGQVELSSIPFSSVSSLVTALDADAEELRAILGASDIRTMSVPADDRREPERLLVLPRYCAMENRFRTIGPYGKLMMCNTAATQVSVDAGTDAAEIARRWDMLDAVGPAMVAAFACSPILQGAPAGNWASQRMRTWLELDGSRTDVRFRGDPVADYASWALDVPLLCIKGGERNWEAPQGKSFADWIEDSSDIGRPPTVDDLDYHLTTLFPHVRACGHLEIRYIDAQPDGQWMIPAAAFEALLLDPDTTRAAADLASSTRGRWIDAARDGLQDNDIRTAAVQLLYLAASRSEHSEMLTAAAERCSNGLMPALENCKESV